MYVSCKKKNLTPRLNKLWLNLMSISLNEGLNILYLFLKAKNETAIRRMTGITLITVPSRIRLPLIVNLVKRRTKINETRFPIVVTNFPKAGF